MSFVTIHTEWERNTWIWIEHCCVSLPPYTIIVLSFSISHFAMYTQAIIPFDMDLKFHSMGTLKIIPWMKNKCENLWGKYGNLKSVVHVQTAWTQNTIIKQSQVSVGIKNLSRKNLSRHHLKATLENNEMMALIPPLFRWRQGTRQGLLYLFSCTFKVNFKCYDFIQAKFSFLHKSSVSPI